MPVGVVVKIVQFGGCALGWRCGVSAAGGGGPKHAFRHLDAILGEHVPVGMQLHSINRQSTGFEVEDECFAGVGVGEDTVDVANNLGAVLECGFDWIFDAWLAVQNRGVVLWMVCAPLFPPVDEDGAIVHPPVVVFFVGASGFAHVFAHSAGGFDLGALFFD